MEIYFIIFILILITIGLVSMIMAIIFIQSTLLSFNDYDDGQYKMTMDTDNIIKTSLMNDTTTTTTTTTYTWPIISTFDDDEEQPENVWFFRH